MPLILNIDTSTETASIGIARDSTTISQVVNESQKDHAAWIQQAISTSLKDIDLSLQDLKAVGLTAGPGSYTGLRVGMATAKGLCYALKIPLITVNTLEAMAFAAITKETDLLCPLIDARRMEVFTALYTKNLEVVVPPAAMVLNENAFRQELAERKILFFGSGRHKLQQLIYHPNAVFRHIDFNASHLSPIINNKYNLSDFTDLTYSEPIYIKDFYTNTFNKR